MVSQTSKISDRTIRFILIDGHDHCVDSAKKLAFFNKFEHKKVVWVKYTKFNSRYKVLTILNFYKIFFNLEVAENKFINLFIKQTNLGLFLSYICNIYNIVRRMNINKYPDHG